VLAGGTVGPASALVSTRDPVARDGAQARERTTFTTASYLASLASGSLPWHPMSNLPVLARSSRLVVHQQKEMLEVFTAFETKNRYEIGDLDGHTSLYAAESGGGGMEWLTRNLLKNKRPFKMQILHTDGSVVAQLRRPWNWFFSELHIEDGQGKPLGMVDQKFAVLSRRFVVVGPSGQELAELHGPLFRPWTFLIKKGDQEIGKIAKKWSGLLKEAFTDADSFTVDLGESMDPDLKLLALAGTFLIDFLYFEGRG
jgi:uncharacterized protein YxjI